LEGLLHAVAGDVLKDGLAGTNGLFAGHSLGGGTPPPNVVAGMKWLPGTDANRSAWRGGVRAFVQRTVQGVGGGREGDCLRTVCEHVSVNPVKAKLVAAGNNTHHNGNNARSTDPFMQYYGLTPQARELNS
jgi:hypothetical protein